MNRTLSPVAPAALALLVAFGLAACGGKHDDDDYTPPESESAGGRERALGLGSIGGVPIIDKAPAKAVVGLGSGVSFSVVAHAPSGAFISGYRWRHGTTILKTGPDSSLAIAAATSSDDGTYTVEVLGSTGNTISPDATLSVVSGAWAPLAGRAVSSDLSSQQPALSHCGDTPKLAWIKTNAAGVDEIRVSHFNGVVWLPLGNALNVNAGESAAEPSIDCSDYSGTPRPVVAWSEGIGNARTIRVKAFDGMGWVSVGSAVAPSGVNVRKPVLRLAPVNGGYASTRHVHARSSLAWLEAGAMRAKFWNGVDWQTYTNGFPSGTRLTELALTLDYEHAAGAARDFTPLFAWIGSLAGGRTPVAAEANVGGWVALGLSPSSATPAATDLRIAGIGFGRDSGSGVNAGGAVAVWTAGSASYSIGSSRLSGSDYDTELSNPFAPAPAWQAYASARIGTGLLATAFDPRELTTQCPLSARRPSFALAVNDSRGTTVLTAKCNAGATDPLDWMPLAPTRSGPVESLSLRTKTDALGATIPVFAAVERVDGRFELAVYQYFP